MSNAKKTSKTLAATIARINERVDAHSSALNELTAQEVASAELHKDAERNAQKHLHHIRKQSAAREALESDGSAASAGKYSAFLDRFQRFQTGNDTTKLAQLAQAIAHKDHERMKNKGLWSATRALAKLVAKYPERESFSWTDLTNANGERIKDNAVSSIRMLAKLGLLEAIKSGQRIDGYTIKDADALKEVTDLFNA